MGLATLEELKQAYTGISTTDDDLLLSLQATADDFIETYCERTFRGGTYAEIFAAGATTVFVKEFPVLDVLSVRIDTAGEFPVESAIPSSRYLVNRARGSIRSVGGPFLASRAGRATRPDDFPGALQVNYTTPEQAIPACVRQASIELTMHWYRAAKTSAGMNYQNQLAKREGETETTYPWRQSTGYQIPDSVLDLLQRYRIPVI